MQRGEQEAEPDDDDRAKPDHDAIDLSFERYQPQIETLLQLPQIAFGSDVVMNGIKYFRGNPLGLGAVDLGIRQGIGQRQSIGQSFASPGTAAQAAATKQDHTL